MRLRTNTTPADWHHDGYVGLCQGELAYAVFIVSDDAVEVLGHPLEREMKDACRRHEVDMDLVLDAIDKADGTIYGFVFDVKRMRGEK